MTEFMNLRSTPCVLGIFGDPVAHPRSPAKQNETLARAGATWIGIANRSRSRAEVLAPKFDDVLRGTTLASCLSLTG